MNKISKSIQFLVLKTNRIWPLSQLYVFCYILAKDIIINIFKKHPQIISIYAKGGTASTLGAAGSSDVDLIFIIRNMSFEKELLFLNWLYKKYRILTIVFPMFSHHKTLNIEEARLHFRLKTLSEGKQFWSRVRCVYGKDVLGDEPTTNLYNIDWAVNIINIFHYLNLELFALRNGNYIRHYAKMIDKILGCLQHIKGMDHLIYLDALSQKNKLIKEANYFIGKSDDFLFDSWTKTICMINDLCAQTELFTHEPVSPVGGTVQGYAPWERNPIKPEATTIRWRIFTDNSNNGSKTNNYNFSLTKYNFEQENQNKLYKAIKPFIYEIMSGNKETKYIIIAPEINTNYQYNIMVVLPKELDLDMVKRNLHNLVDTYRRMKTQWDDYFLSPPLVIMENTAKLYIDKIISPMDLISIARHGKVFCNTDEAININLQRALEDINNLTYRDLAGSILLGPPLGTNVTETLIRAIDAKDLKNTAVCLDMILGAIPAKRLLLEKGIITTSPREAYQEFIDNFKANKETEFYKSAYQRFYFNITRESFLKEVEENLDGIHEFTRLNTNVILSLVEKRSNEFNG